MMRKSAEYIWARRMRVALYVVLLMTLVLSLYKGMAGLAFS